MFPRNENRNEGKFACSPGTKTGMRVHSPKPPFYEPALLSPSDLHQLLSVAPPAEPRGEKTLFFVQILGGEKLLKFGEKWAVKHF